MSNSISTPTPPREKIRFRGELALCIIAVLNSFAVYLMLYSGAGMPAISSVPYAVSESFPILSLGTWTYMFQTSLVIALMVLRKRFVPSYLLAFVVGVVFGKMMDVHALWIDQLPLTPVLRVVYFVVSFFALAFGIALSNHCKLPIIPTDLFPRELSVILNRPYKTVKTVFDLVCLAATAALLVLFIHRLQGIGIGTVFGALFMGRVASWMGQRLERYFTFVSFLEK